MSSNVGFQIHAWQDVFTYQDQRTGFFEVYPIADWTLANGTSLTAYHQRNRWNTTGLNFCKKKLKTIIVEKTIKNLRFSKRIKSDIII